jgi:hypothetical protein
MICGDKIYFIFYLMQKTEKVLIEIRYYLIEIQHYLFDYYYYVDYYHRRFQDFAMYIRYIVEHHPIHLNRK